jgi:hypothetical protein
METFLANEKGRPMAAPGYFFYQLRLSGAIQTES